jgi:hypothetical protein
MRKEKQDKLKERVTTSKSLVDNTQTLHKKRKDQQENFKKNLQEQKNNYQEDLARRLQKVYNKPLMFEQSMGKTKKITTDKTMLGRIHAAINDVNNNDDDNEYEEKFDYVV